MVRAEGWAVVRGEILAAAAIVGVPVDVHDGAEWAVTDGRARVGLGALPAAAGAPDDAAAAVLLLLWESVREARVAPARRQRRLAVEAATPALGPLLAAIDRLLAATELLAVMPGLRLPLVRALERGAWSGGAGAERPPGAELPPGAQQPPGELLRHLQWVRLVIDTVALRWRSGGDAVPAYAAGLAPETVRELRALDEAAAGDGPGVLQLALSAAGSFTPMERFERAYGVLAPPYIRLLALDAAGRGPAERGDGTSGDSGDAGASAPGFESGAGDDGAAGGDDAELGGDGGEVADEDTAQARAGDGGERAEGADLFAAEQAGFVQTVLATPLPAAGTWAADLELPDVAARPEPDGPTERPQGAGAPGAAGRPLPTVAEYRGRVAEHARSIEAVRQVWREIVHDGVTEQRGFSRTPEPWGEQLDPDALVRAVTEAAAGVQRPHAFQRRSRQFRAGQRDGGTDYVLLVDRSASMQGAPADAAATAALIMLEALAGVARDIQAEERALGVDLGVHLRTALIVFDATPRLVKPLAGALTDDVRRELDAAIHTPQGSTNDAAALALAAEQLTAAATPGGLARRRIVVLVSDGGTNDQVRAAREIAGLRALGVTVLGIGLQTDDLRARFAPDGVRLDSAAALPGALMELITRAGLTG